MAQIGALLLVVASFFMWCSRGRRWRRERRLWADSPFRTGGTSGHMIMDDIDRTWAKVTAGRQTGRYTANLALACLTLVGVLDVVLILTQQPTVTQYIQALVPNLWARVGVMMFAVGQTWAVFGRKGALTVALGCIYGHLFW